MKRILVTGSNGQLGSELRVLADANSQVTEWVFTDRSELDFLNIQSIVNCLDLYKPDFVINCAAYTAVDKAESESEVADLVNHQAVGVIANWTSSNNKKLIHISTDYVFDGQSSIPLMEHSVTSPINVYCKTKLLGELACLKEDPNSLIIRTSWVYSSFGSNFVKTMLRLMREREQIKIVNDQIGSPTYGADLASAIVSIVNENKWNSGIYHYSNDGEITWYQFAQDIKELAGLRCDLIGVNSSEYPTTARRPAFSLLDKSKIVEHFNIVVPDYKERLRVCLEQIIIFN